MIRKKTLNELQKSMNELKAIFNNQRLGKNFMLILNLSNF